jgi:hypothetical protein
MKSARQRIMKIATTDQKVGCVAFLFSREMPDV